MSEFVATTIFEDARGNGVALHKTGLEPCVHLGRDFHGQDFRAFMERAVQITKEIDAPTVDDDQGRYYVPVRLMVLVAEEAGRDDFKHAVLAFAKLGMAAILATEMKDGQR